MSKQETPPIRQLVELATRAPSVHNTQPWFWGVAGDRLVLFADESRQLMHADPDGRGLILSCGAALHHFQVAAAGAGWRTAVRRMPNPYNDAQLANISFHPEPATRPHAPPWMHSSVGAPTAGRPPARRYPANSWTLCSPSDRRPV